MKRSVKKFEGILRDIKDFLQKYPKSYIFLKFENNFALIDYNKTVEKITDGKKLELIIRRDKLKLTIIEIL